MRCKSRLLLNNCSSDTYNFFRYKLQSDKTIVNGEWSIVLTLAIAYCDALSQSLYGGTAWGHEITEAALHEIHFPLQLLFLCSNTACLVWNATLH
jgi:hypothetical protein